MKASHGWLSPLGLLYQRGQVLIWSAAWFWLPELLAMIWRKGPVIS